MAIDFTKLGSFARTEIAPELPEGYYRAKLTAIDTIAAQPATANAKAKSEQLVLSFDVTFGKWQIPQQIRIPGWKETLTTKQGRKFQPITTFLGPVRSQSGIPDMNLETALQFAETQGVNVGYHRNDRGYLELKVTYPQRQTDDDDLDNQMPSDI